MAVPLAMLLNDPYDAVRYIAHRSLESLPGFEGFQYDFLAPPAERTAATLTGAGALAAHAAPVRPEDPTLHFCSMPLVLPEMDAIVRLGLQRNDRPVVLRE